MPKRKEYEPHQYYPYDKGDESSYHDDGDKDFKDMIKRGGYTLKTHWSGPTQFGIHIVTEPNGDKWIKRVTDYPELTEK